MADVNPYLKYKKPVATDAASADVNPYLKYRTTNSDSTGVGGGGIIDGHVLPPNLAMPDQPQGAGPQPGDHSWAQLPGMIGDAIMHPGQTLGNLGQGVVSAVNAIPSDTGQFVSNLGNGIVGAVAGIPNDVMHPIQTLANIGLGLKHAIQQSAGTPEALQRAVTQHPVQTAALVATGLTGSGEMADAFAPGSTLAQGLKTAGNVVNPINVPANVLRAVAATNLPVVGNAASLALGIGGAAKNLPVNAVKYLYKTSNPKANFYNLMTEGMGPQIAAAVDNPANIIVPGTQPTVADLAARATTLPPTKLAAVTKQAQDLLSSENMARQQAGNAAVLGSLQDIAGAPGAQAAAEDARATTTRPMYDAVTKQVVPGDEKLSEIFGTPSGQKALQVASRIAGDERVPFQFGGAPAQTVTSSVLDKFGNPIQYDTPEEMAKYPGGSIQYLKLALDKMITHPDTFGIDAATVRGIKSVRKDFTGWANKNLPGFEDVNQTYADMSKPVDRMLVGQELVNALKPVLDDNESTVRGATLGRAVQNAPQTIEKATDGRSIYNDFSQINTPDEVNKINAAVDELSRQDYVRKLAAAGAKSAPNLLTPVSDNAALARFPGFMHPVVTVANELIRRVGGGLDTNLATEIAKELVLNPQGAKDSINAMLAHQAKGQANALMFGRIGNILGTTTRYPGVYNTIGASNQQSQPVNAFNAR